MKKINALAQRSTDNGQRKNSKGILCALRVDRCAAIPALFVIVLSGIVVFLSMGSPLFAQMPVSMPGAVVSSGLEKIGVVGAAAGRVELKTPGQAGRIAESGQSVFVGDEVTTDEKGHLQILLLDETVFTIGPNSAITIDRFVFDSGTRNGEIKASVAKGVFRYVSGKIAVKNPNKVTVKLPTSTLGFRGTIVGGSVGADGQGIVGLLGPGGNNDANAQIGSFTITGDGGGSETVDRSGFGVQIGANGGISNPFQFSQEQVNQLTQGLGFNPLGVGSSGSGGLGGNSNMGGLSGENGALAGQNTELMQGLNNLSDNLINNSNQVIQDNRTENGSNTSTSDVTTYEQLQAASGSGYYSGSGAFSGNSEGLQIYGEINFGPEGSIGGGDSYVSVSDGAFSTPNTDSTFLSSEGQSFGGSGPASFNWPGVEGENGGIFDITVTLANSGEVTAQTATVTVNYDHGEGFGPASGTGTVVAPLSISNGEIA